jgi:hypothetical protein
MTRRAGDSAHAHGDGLVPHMTAAPWPASGGFRYHGEAVPRLRWVPGPMLLALAVVRSANAETVHVAYVVECPDFLRAGSRLQRGLTLEVYATRNCDGPALTERYVVVDAAASPARRADTRRSTDATRRPPALVLEADIALETAPRAICCASAAPGRPMATPARGGGSRWPSESGVPLARNVLDSVRRGDLCVDHWADSGVPAARVDLVCR